MDDAPHQASPIMASPYPFQGKVITITGASRGTGEALARYLLTRGATVSMCSSVAANITAAAERLAADFPTATERIMHRAVDIKDLAAVQAWIRDTVQAFGAIDACANVAGKEQRDIYPITSLSPDTFDDLLRTNLTGTFNLLKAQMAAIRDGGSIVNVASVASNYASAGVAGYITSKHGLIGLTKAAAFEGAPRGIRVNAICPGSTDTVMMQKPFNLPDGSTFMLGPNDVPQLFKRFAQPEEVAASIAFLLGDESKFVTKAAWYCDGGWLESSYTA